mgnify:CR=1 FL=1
MHEKLQSKGNIKAAESVQINIANLRASARRENINSDDEKIDNKIKNREDDEHKQRKNNNPPLKVNKLKIQATTKSKQTSELLFDRD